MSRILIIEDDDDFRKMLRIMLSQAGYEVLESSNGREGVTAYESDRIDLVITDIFMPEKEGIQTVLELKEINPMIKIIAISGGGSRDKLEYLESVKELGVQKTYEKPFVSGEFLEGIKELLES